MNLLEIEKISFQKLYNTANQNNSDINSYLNRVTDKGWYCTKHDCWWIIKNVFFHNYLSCLIPKTIIRIFNASNIIVKLILVKNFIEGKKCKKSLMSITVYGRRHSKLFTYRHVPWDILYAKFKLSFHPWVWMLNN